MQHATRVLLLLTLAGSVGGCIAYHRQPLDVESELASLRSRDLQHFVVERFQPGQSAAGSSPMFDPSDGLNEAEVVAVALTLNPELKAKRAEIGGVKAALITAGLWPNPEVAVSPKVGIGGASSYRVDADVLFQLLRPGERDARKQIAHAHIAQTETQLVAEEFKLVAEVRTQRLAVLAADREVALLKEALELRQKALDLVQRRRQAGEGTELETSATELEMAEARRDLRKAEADLRVEIGELNRLMGLPPDYRVKLTELGEPLTVTVFEDVADDELDHRVLAGRLELRTKEYEYRRAEQELRLAVLQQYPRLSLGPALERELDGSKSLGLGLSLELPLLNQNQGEIAEKKAARERIRADYTAMLHRLRADAFAARATVRNAKQEVEIQEKDILPLLKRNQDLFERAFRARELNIFDWITAQNRAVNARREYLDGLVRYRKAVIRLESASGQPLAPPIPPSTQPNRSDK
jgi:cobalt-zinc-cadmium efflux system outer membrane protein